eukprot:3007437-Lingulodinium_polyedra.AAC.1
MGGPQAYPQPLQLRRTDCSERQASPPQCIGLHGSSGRRSTALGGPVEQHQESAPAGKKASRCSQEESSAGSGQARSIGGRGRR